MKLSVKQNYQYVVYDNNRMAQYPEVAVPPSWDCATFTSFRAALNYAKLWLGDTYVSMLPVQWDGSPVDYNEYGDKIEIRMEMCNDEKES
jgi:hypothetical protein